MYRSVEMDAVELERLLDLVRQERLAIAQDLATEEYSLDDRSEKYRRLSEIRSEEREYMDRLAAVLRGGGGGLIGLVPVDS